ncbi:bacteriohemerythrin [Wukongibacter baidiensis]|uniref:bacteriohemerythrin n=1 Tax=Wukongibacter baidiensis TaxID=1723361 RepID=UPI003D7F4F80
MFNWKEEYSVGIKTIDDQHKKLFEIGERINIVLESYNGQDSYDEIVELIEELKDYTIYHFDSEESLLAKYQYPELDEQIKEHKTFVDYLEGLDFDNIDEDQENAMKELIMFIAKWIFKHISNSDFRYSEFLIEAMK